MTLAERIRTMRIAAGFHSQGALAEACGWILDSNGSPASSRVSNYEQGTREPSLAHLRDIAAACAASGYSYAWLAVGPEELHGVGASQSARLDPETLRESIHALRRVAANEKLPYDPETHPEVTLYVYELASALSDAPSMTDVIDFSGKVAERLRQKAEVERGQAKGKQVGVADRGGIKGA